MSTWVLILFFGTGTYQASVAVDGFATQAACDRFAQRAKEQEGAGAAYYTTRSVSGWLCVEKKP